MREAATDEFIPYTYIALGSDNFPPSANDTELGSEFIRKEALSEDIRINPERGTYEITTIFNPSEGNGNSIRETGLFDSSSEGNMSLRKLTNEYEKTSDKEILITQEVSIDVVNA